MMSWDWGGLTDRFLKSKFQMKRKDQVRAKLNSVNHKQKSDSQFIACVTLMLEEDWGQVQFS